MSREEVAQLRAEVAELRSAILHLNHVVGELNHDVRVGNEEALPLFLGAAERFRSDADSAVSASEVIARQLRRLEERIAALDDKSSPADA